MDDMPAFEDEMNSSAENNDLSDDISADIAVAADIMETDTWDGISMTRLKQKDIQSQTVYAISLTMKALSSNDQDSPDTEQDTSQQNGECPMDSCLQPSDI